MPRGSSRRISTCRGDPQPGGDSLPLPSHFNLLPRYGPRKPGIRCNERASYLFRISRTLAGRTLPLPVAATATASLKSAPQVRRGNTTDRVALPSPRPGKPVNAALQQQNRRPEGGAGSCPRRTARGEPRQAVQHGMQPEGYHVRPFPGHPACWKRLVAAYATPSGGEVPCIL